jgi:pimeloyl-ACP methyl ester carboxylesterase
MGRFARVDRRSPMPGRRVVVNGVGWHVEEAGEGEPSLLLFPGYLGSTAGWRRLLPALGARFRVVAVDFPGAGYSDRPANLPYHLHWLTEQVPALLQTLELERPFLGGHSFGSSVAIHASAKYPGICRGLVLAAPLVYQQLPPPGLRFAKRHPRIAGTFFNSPAGRAVIPWLVRRVAYAGRRMKASVRVQRLIDHLDAPGGWEAATTMGLSAGETMPTAVELARVHVPTLLFWGRHDPVHPVAHAPRVVEDLGGPCELDILEDSAHNCHEEEWERFAERTRAFCLTVFANDK